MVNIQRQSYWDVYFYICPKSLGFTPILKHRAKQGGTTAALSVGHAYTDELTQHKHLKSALLLWVMLCILISLYIQLIELMTLSEIGGGL